MAASAFVLIETAVGRSKEVVNTISKIKGVKLVNTGTGPYDIIALMEADNLNDIGDLITGNIHDIDGISRTVTCLTV